MIVVILKKAAVVRTKVSSKIGKKIVGAEAVTHLLYGVAVFAEAHGEITTYSVAAVSLGVMSVLHSFFGGE